MSPESGTEIGSPGASSSMTVSSVAPELAIITLTPFVNKDYSKYTKWCGLMFPVGSGDCARATNVVPSFAMFVLALIADSDGTSTATLATITSSMAMDGL